MLATETTKSSLRRYAFRCYECSRKFSALATPGAFSAKNGAAPVDADCPNCGTSVRGIRIKGILRPNKKCDARCTSAAGFTCECSCGGLNHGMDCE